VETKACDLRGLTVMGTSPGLVWAHGLGSSVASDERRGVCDILNPRILGRTVLRVDLRGHGLSAAVWGLAQKRLTIPREELSSIRGPS
ncbi:unnamed protein product, partial [Polarella glacialis]